MRGTPGGEHERLLGLARELVAAKPDIVVTAGTPAARAAIKVTAEIPMTARRLSETDRACGAPWDRVSNAG